MQRPISHDVAAPAAVNSHLHVVIHQPHVAVIGGVVNKLRERLSGTGLRCYGSAHHSGNGELQRLLAAIRGGTIDEVWILFRSIGHSEVRRLRATCKACGITYTLVTGISSIRKRLGART